ncbi:cytochrome d ubiquinol oxidase subunit II [Burkholderia multivorans]|uniref:Ubiquinol oxidase subunit II n=1 Tax=Burkholderia multivorans TaxID=87883 RepID=A0AB37ANB8_9BURK|nr:cytochrome d ubiquinol oxidase subunit II [Burkholderia multivorans]MBU9589658.1 cytochrome d ubiquinol oxidase subunit II [Burkholderia multivorans]PRE39269.1 ubiquinol oxidase subunit II [Burkholderia multivorans]PRE42309.1 ubiquinol oxidase subunit II [Burkholderia multivorans]
MNTALSHICILIAIFSIVMYVLLDGFDLGVGILLLIPRQGRERDDLIESIAPIWDGNETWLILAAIVLFGAFPLAYSILVPACYIPFMVMLVALGFRGVAMEFRFHTPFPRFWDGAFSVASALAAFAQGLVAGALLSGDITIADGKFSGHTQDVFTGFNALTGLTAVAAYATLGASWLRWKTDDSLQRYRLPVLRVVMLAFLALTVAACIFAASIPIVATMWVTHPVRIGLLGAISGALWISAFAALNTASDIRPLLYNLAVVAVLLIGFVNLLWPYVVPFSLTFADAAAAPGSQLMVAVGAIVLLPVVLGYNAFAYWVFRGKVGSSQRR